MINDRDFIKSSGQRGLAWLENHIRYNVLNGDEPLKAYSCGESINLDDYIDSILTYFKEFDIKVTKSKLVKQLVRVVKCKEALRKSEEVIGVLHI